MHLVTTNKMTSSLRNDAQRDHQQKLHVNNKELPSAQRDHQQKLHVSNKKLPSVAVSSIFGGKYHVCTADNYQGTHNQQQSRNKQTYKWMKTPFWDLHHSLPHIRAPLLYKHEQCAANYSDHFCPWQICHFPKFPKVILVSSFSLQLWFSSRTCIRCDYFYF